MKRYALLIFAATLSACAADMTNGNESKNASLGQTQAVRNTEPETTVDYMTGQENDLKSVLQLFPAEIERQGNELILTFDDADIFKENAADISPEAQTVLKTLAGIFSRYDKTRIGITDYAAGNSEKAEKRARTLAAFLNGSAPLNKVRFWTEGEAQPFACPKEGDCLKNNHIRITLTPTFIR